MANKYRKNLQNVSVGNAYSFDECALLKAIESEMMRLGGGIMTDYERFFIDSPAFFEEGDHWMDIRDY